MGFAYNIGRSTYTIPIFDNVIIATRVTNLRST